jgi:hypothetical protein
MNQPKDKHDEAVEDSFPASDPPASTGITGPRVNPTKPGELKDDDDKQQSE